MITHFQCFKPCCCLGDIGDSPSPYSNFRTLVGTASFSIASFHISPVKHFQEITSNNPISQNSSAKAPNILEIYISTNIISTNFLLHYTKYKYPPVKKKHHISHLPRSRKGKEHHRLQTKRGGDMMSSVALNRGTSARSLNDTSSPPTASFHISTTFRLTSV